MLDCVMVVVSGLIFVFFYFSHYCICLKLLETERFLQ